MHTEALTYESGGARYTGYLAVDETRAGKRPGILVCPEANGVHDEAKARCRRLAELGYAAFALDFIGNGEVLDGLDKTMALLEKLRADIDGTRAIARAGLDVLLGRSEVDPARVAAIGYCFGGTLAIDLARTGAPLGCVVGFHAALTNTRPEDSRNIKGKILVCNGADDPMVPPEQRLAFEQEMRAAKVDWRLYLFGNAVHGFSNPEVDKRNHPALRYHKPTHERSWRAMRDLLDETFGAP